jgi:hypothetical protein
MPCPHLIGGLSCPSELCSTLESCVAAPIRGVNDSTIAGSPRGSSSIWAEVNTIVSPPPVRVRSTLGPPAMLFITGLITSVSVSVEARYAEGDLDARLGSVSAPSVSSTSVEARSTGGWAPIAACEPDAMSVACTSPEVACSKSRAPPQLRVADQLAFSKSRSPLPRTVQQPWSVTPL